MSRRLLYACACATLTFAASLSSADARPVKRVCSAKAGRHALCNAIVVVDSKGAPLATSTPVRGYTPSDLQSAYGLAAAAQSAGGGQTVAIVDAYDDPNAEADLATYRANFPGLAPCTTANGCFRKIDQNGGTNYPAPDASWAQEVSLDLDMVSAVCPNCHILLVEASSANFGSLGVAVNTAASLGATQISNSYGAAEFSSASSYENSYYKHPGIDVTVSSGDSGYGTQFPADSQYVTAVGGTHLTRSGSGWAESAWSGAGSGCSAYIPKPSWQKDTGCARRTVADVSAVADPNTGVATYDSYNSGGTNWRVYGGTSVAAPLIAAMDALAGGRAGTPGSPLWGSYSYSHLSAFTDVTSGSNGSCSASYLCNATAGYDGPTGNGSPNGLGGTPPPPPPPSDELPTASFTSSPASPTAGGPVAFNASASSDPDGSISTYSWSFGDGTTGAGAAPSHTYNSPGTYQATLQVTDSAGLTASTSQSITVAVAPPPPPPAGDENPTVSFTSSNTSRRTYVRFAASGNDPDGSIRSYAWNFGDGTTATRSAGVHHFPRTGNYTVTITVTDSSGLTASSTQVVSVA